MKHLKLFENWQADFAEQVKRYRDLQDLAEIGIIDQQQLANVASSIKAKASKFLKQYKPYSAEWIEAIKQIPIFNWLTELMETPEYRALISAGLQLVSSPAQLYNRTLAFARAGSFDKTTDYSIGVFGPNRSIRRIEPSTSTAMHSKIKSFKSSSSEQDFFREAMAWIPQHLDLTDRFYLTKKMVKTTSTQAQQSAVINELLTKVLIKNGKPAERTGSPRNPVDHLAFILCRDAASRTSSITGLTSLLEGKPAAIKIYVSDLDTGLIDIMSLPGVTWILDTQTIQYTTIQYTGTHPNLSNFNFKFKQLPTHCHKFSLYSNDLTADAEAWAKKFKEMGVNTIGYISSSSEDAAYEVKDAFEAQGITVQTWYSPTRWRSMTEHVKVFEEFEPIDPTALMDLGDLGLSNFADKKLREAIRLFNAGDYDLIDICEGTYDKDDMDIWADVQTGIDDEWIRIGINYKITQYGYYTPGTYEDPPEGEGMDYVITDTQIEYIVYNKNSGELVLAKENKPEDLSETKVWDLFYDKISESI